MKNWELIVRLKRLPDDAETFFVSEPAIIPADDPGAMDLVAVERVELDPDGSVVLS